MTNQRVQIQQVVGSLIALLVARRYRDAELMTKGIRLKADDLSRAIEQYGRTLVVPSDAGWNLMETTEVRNSDPIRWAVVMPLWTKQEGRSDLSLECTVIERPDGYAIELDDIHVL